MDEHATRARQQPHASTDLASIVLGNDDAGRRWDAPESVPIDHGFRTIQPGFDARSAAVLALVVALLAGIVGWATTVGDEGATVNGAEPRAESPAVDEGAAKASAASGVTASDSTDTGFEPAASPVAANDLAIGRVVPGEAASGAGLVAVGIANAGNEPFEPSADDVLLVLVSGEVVATEPLPSIDPGESTRVSISLDTCPYGTVPLTVVLDPSATVREGDERNNSVSRSATFGC